MPRLPVALAMAALTLAVAGPRRADACGGFFSANASALPSIAVERVLLIHDEEAGVEHFIREIAFDKVDKPFGFVIPTPSRPGVFKADGVPWASLERAFPMVAPDGRPGAGFGSGHGRLGGSGVTVLEAKPLGSFAAYVLRATDEKGLKGWLDRNQFVTTPASESWLAHYVKLGFHFVALRFDPGLHRAKVKREHRRELAETMRITFETPVPFYPYREPDREDLSANRALVLWLVTRGEPKIPVALVEEDGQLSYRRPWREGPRPSPVSADSLVRLAGEEVVRRILPAGEAEWRVQVFEDQKRSRRGFGDVALVAEEPRRDAMSREKLRTILPILDPGLEAP